MMSGKTAKEDTMKKLGMLILSLALIPFLLTAAGTEVSRPQKKACINQTDANQRPAPQISGNVEAKAIFVGHSTAAENACYSRPVPGTHIAIVPTEINQNFHPQTSLADEIVLNQYQPHSAPAIDFWGSETYCGFECVYSGSNCIYVSRKTNDDPWQGWNGFYSTRPWFSPALVATQNYISIPFDQWSPPYADTLICARRPKSGGNWELYYVDYPWCGTSDAVSDIGDWVWLTYNYEPTATDYDVLFAKSPDGGATWQGYVTVWGAGSSATHYMPRICVDPTNQNHLYIVWWDFNASTLYYATSLNGGATWAVYSFTGVTGTYPDVACYGNSALIVATSSVGGNLHFISTTNNGTNWSRRTSSAAGYSYPAVSCPASQYAVAVYSGGTIYGTGGPSSQVTNFDPNTLIARSDAGGAAADRPSITDCPVSAFRSHCAFTSPRSGQAVYSSCSITEIEENADGGSQLPLIRLAPNPFTSIIRITCPDGYKGRISIYDHQGRQVKSIAPQVGRPMVNWDGKDEKGQVLPSGIYFCKLESSNVDVRKIVKLK